jgi:hypothetical protein
LFLFSVLSCFLSVLKSYTFNFGSLAPCNFNNGFFIFLQLLLLLPLLPLLLLLHL